MKNIRNRDIVLGVFALVIVFQTLHFHFYFGRELGQSIFWATVDWGIWFLIFWGGYKLLSAGAHKPIKIASFILLTGTVHILATSTIYGLTQGWDKSLNESLLHLTNKRWLQNLMIAGLYIAVLHLYLIRTSKTNSDESSGRIKLTNGSRSYFFEYDQIIYIQSERNYVTVHTKDEALIFRNSLKTIK